MCQILKKSGNPKDFEQILDLLLPSIKTKIDEYIIEQNFNNLSLSFSFIARTISFCSSSYLG